MTIRNITLFLVFILKIIHINAQIPEPTFDWANKIGNSGTTSARFITVDEIGNVYTWGGFAHTSLTVNGTTINTGSLTNSSYLIKYDSLGNSIWIKHIPLSHIPITNNPKKILAYNGYVYLLGYYGGSAGQQSFDGIQLPFIPSNQAAYVLLQVNTDNAMVNWANPIDFKYQPAPQTGNENAIYFDQQYNIHVVSNFQTTTDFNDGEFILTNPDSTQIDAFRAVYDTSGNLLSTVRFGENNGVHSEGAHFFDMDKQNNTYRYVDDENTLLKYSPQGDTLWTKELSISGGTLDLNAMKVDPWGNIFFAGSIYGGTVYLEDSVIQPYNGSQRTDAVLFKLNFEDGSLVWIKQREYIYCDNYSVMTIDDIGNVYVGGSQSAGCPGLGGAIQLPFEKWTNSGTKLWEKTINSNELASALNIVQAKNGGNVLIGGYFKGNINFGNGNTLTDNAMVNGNPANRAFIAKYGLCNNTPQPQINAANTGFCEGDSLLLSVASPDPAYSYLWSRSPHDTTTSIYVKESGTYSVFAIDSTGECYGKSQEIWITNAPLPDTTVTVQNNILTATENAQGTTYQWIDCENNNTPISGATAQTFEPAQNGDYAVILTSVESCVDTSACYTITTVGIENNLSLNDQITVYPNPTNGKLYVETDLDIKELTIFDLQGKKLLTSNTKEIDILGLPTSVYILEITLLDNEQWRTKVIKE